MKEGDIIASLTNFSTAAAVHEGPQWIAPIQIGEGYNARTINVELPRFICALQYEYSKIDPFLLKDTNQICDLKMGEEREPEVRIWAVYRDNLYLIFVDPAYKRSENIENAKKAIKKMDL